MSKIGLKRNVIHALIGEKVSCFLDEIQTILNTDISSVEEYKYDKIKQLCRHVSDNIPYYKTVMQHSLEPLSGHCLYKFPYMTKEDIRQNHKNLLFAINSGSMRHTSGTMGIPLVFHKDANASAYMNAAMYNAYSWYGITAMDRQARVWGSGVGAKSRIFQNTKDYILDRKRLSAFKITREESSHFYDRLLKFKPKYFYCYPNALYQFALSLETQNLCGEKLKIPFAICTGEVLYPFQREKIEEFFKCSVVNEYGSTENGIIGFECEYKNLHVLPTVHLEILEPDGDGYGKIVVTELNSRSIPFLRYINGDIGKLINENCKCGRPLSILKVRDGRVDSYIKCPDGRIVYDAILAYTIGTKVEQFKAYQNNINNLKIYYIKNPDLNYDDKIRIIKDLRRYLGSELVINLERVNVILPENSGKLRYFVSEI